MPQPPVIILVAPQMGENIGAAARAMANFGLTDLRLVTPRDGWPNDKAVANAAGALDPDGPVTVQIYDHFENALADLQYILATTARRRDMVKSTYTPRTAMELVQQKSQQEQKCGIAFGRERNGLENSEVAQCHAVLNIPTNPDFSSLNLSQAVLLLGYEWLLGQTDTTILPAENTEPPPAAYGDVHNFLQRLESELDKGGFFRTEGLKPHMIRNIQNIFTRNELTTQEVNTLQGILSLFAKT